MLSPSTHPAGSQAMLRGTPGTIRQWLAGGVAVFFPQRGQSYRAAASELDPLPALPPFEGWAAERIANVQGMAATTADAVYADYLAWCGRHAVAEVEILSGQRFAWAMHRAGYRRDKRAIKVAGDCQHRWRTCWKLALHAAPVGNLVPAAA